MKNERYFANSVAKLRADGHLPDRVLALSDDDIIATVQSVLNVSDEIAVARSEVMELDLNDDDLLKAMLAAHSLDITFTEFVERALVEAMEREVSNRTALPPEGSS